MHHVFVLQPGFGERVSPSLPGPRSSLFYLLSAVAVPLTWFGVFFAFGPETPGNNLFFSTHSRRKTTQIGCRNETRQKKYIQSHNVSERNSWKSIHNWSNKPFSGNRFP